jgi:hypothetical protein
MRSHQARTLSRRSSRSPVSSVTSFALLLGYVIPHVLTTVRSDLAEFLLRGVEDSAYDRQAVAVATPGARLPGPPRPPVLLGGAAAVALLGIALRSRRIRTFSAAARPSSDGSHRTASRVLRVQPVEQRLRQVTGSTG